MAQLLTLDVLIRIAFVAAFAAFVWLVFLLERSVRKFSARPGFADDLDEADEIEAARRALADAESLLVGALGPRTAAAALYASADRIAGQIAVENVPIRGGKEWI